MNQSQYGCYLSVDLEDYKHATMRDMGLSPLANPEQTRRGVYRILSVLCKTESHPNITLFTTGHIARKQADLVHELSKMDHEIACHSDQHEDISTLDAKSFLDNLRRAKTSLEDASGQEVIGFRAPNFSIDERCPWAYNTLLEAGFRYDSSMVKSIPRWKKEAYEVLECSEKKLFEFPIYRHNTVSKFGVRVIGGTYFRLLPITIILKLMMKAVSVGYMPLIYLHASDADQEASPVRWEEMSELSLSSRIQWRIRQKQWSLGAKSTVEKLVKVLKIFPNLGPMRTALPL